MARYDSEAKNLLIVNGVIIVLMTLCMILRCAARLKTRNIHYLSDGLCLVAYAVSIAIAALLFDYLHNTAVGGVFRPHNITDPTDVPHVIWFQAFSKLRYISQLLYSFDYAVVKFSILAFLWDVFGADSRNKLFIKIVTVACIMWCIAFTFLAAFRCKNPVDGWTTNNPPELCIYAPHVFIPFESTNLFFDVVILSIPAFAVQKLKLDKWKKFSVIGIFLLGGSVCVASIVRLAEISKTIDWAIFFWSMMQLGLSIICACLPTLGALFRSSSNQVGSSSKYSGFTSSSGKRGSGIAFKVKDVELGDRGPWIDNRAATGTTSWARQDNDGSESELPPEPMFSSRITTV